MRVTRLAAALAATALTLTACGGDDEPEQDATVAAAADLPAHEGLPGDRKVQLKKMCEALGDAEVSEVLGEDVTRGATVRSNCTFADLSDLRPSVSLVVLPVDTLGGVGGVVQALTGEDGEEPETVEGVGDDAFLRVHEGDDGAVATAAMVVRKTSLQLQVTLGADAGAEATKEKAIALLELVDGRLAGARAGQGD